VSKSHRLLGVVGGGFVDKGGLKIQKLSGFLSVIIGKILG
jgi:hypothetical protein